MPHAALVMGEKAVGDVAEKEEHERDLAATRGSALLLALYERLSPGGLLAIGNALGPNNHAWMCEFACDWTLIYRDRDDLRQLAEPAIAQGATLELQSEASRAYDFILLRKP